MAEALQMGAIAFQDRPSLTSTISSPATNQTVQILVFRLLSHSIRNMDKVESPETLDFLPKPFRLAERLPGRAAVISFNARARGSR